MMACFEVRAWHAIYFLRSCRGPALAELGHPDVAAGRYSCAARSHGCGKPFRTESAGRHPDLINCATTAPKYLSASLSELSAVPHPSIPLPTSAHTLPEPRASGLLPTHPAPTTPPSRRGREKGVGERPVCSVATSGCPKRSEDGFPAGARNIPPRPVQRKPHPKLLA